LLQFTFFSPIEDFKPPFKLESHFRLYYVNLHPPNPAVISKTLSSWFSLLSNQANSSKNKHYPDMKHFIRIGKLIRFRLYSSLISD